MNSTGTDETNQDVATATTEAQKAQIETNEAQHEDALANDEHKLNDLEEVHTEHSDQPTFDSNGQRYTEAAAPQKVEYTESGNPIAKVNPNAAGYQAKTGYSNGVQQAVNTGDASGPLTDPVGNSLHIVDRDPPTAPITNPLTHTMDGNVSQHIGAPQAQADGGKTNEQTTVTGL